MGCRSLAGLLLLTAPANAAQRAETSPGAKLDLTPFAKPERAELVPVLAGERVLLTSTLRLYAFDACSGELAWSAGPPAAWDQLAPAAREALFAGLAPGRMFVAPAAGERVAVAALQIPRSRQAPENWDGMVIWNALPERRLFAFDLASGK